ncbi:tyrosine-type recombinase/integrase [Salmonella enterica subsp. enterica]|nr:tyrosine-type recombinase/integrase [Salmonella enterica subsp. enterica serovar Mikawasima]HCP9901793.1 tyrosine-type recombinase/integrase [Salmonella enterica]
MGRPRKNPADEKLPKRVSRGRSAFEFKPRSGGTVRLCDLSESLAKVWEAFEKMQKAFVAPDTFAALVERFLKSQDFRDLSLNTQSDYAKYARRVVKPFGKMKPSDIKPAHIRKYMDIRGQKSRVQANREKAFMSRVFRWGYERGLVDLNPCQGVRQYTEQARERYITDAEYNALYEVADDVVRVAMEIAYLCCARKADVLGLKASQIMPEGIFIRQGKTGVRQIKAWSPRLEAAVALAKSFPRDAKVVSTFIICQPSGDKYTASGLSNRWRLAKTRAKEKYPALDFDFTFHDLKAKGISDLEGSLQEKQAISGHKNIGQTARYDRKIKVVPTVDGQHKKAE